MATEPTDMPELLYESHADDELRPCDDHLRLALARPVFRVYVEDRGLREYGWVRWKPSEKSHTTIFVPSPEPPPNGPAGPASKDSGALYQTVRVAKCTTDLWTRSD